MKLIKQIQKQTSSKQCKSFSEADVPKNLTVADLHHETFSVINIKLGNKLNLYNFCIFDGF